MQVNVKVDTSGLDKIAREMPKAVQVGMNKTAEQARTRTSEMIRAKYNITKGNLEKPAPGKSKGSWLMILNAKGKRLATILRISGNRIPLYRFGAKWRRKWAGARVSVEGGRSATYAHTFIARMKSGHMGVFIRKSLVKPGNVSAVLPKTTRTAKLPANRQIVEEAGPAPGQMVKKGDMLKRLQTFIAEKAPGLILHEFTWRKGK